MTVRPDQQRAARPRRKRFPGFDSLEGRAVPSHAGFPSVSYPPSGPPPTPPPVSAPPPTPTPTPPPSQAPPIQVPTAPAPGSLHLLPRSGSASTPDPAAPPRRIPHHVHPVRAHASHPKSSGVVTKSPSFYGSYTGPQRAELNAVKAGATLVGRRTFVFTGTNQGPINQGPATYVWGVDRSGNLPPGPFDNRPEIRFDAVVIVQLDASMNVTASVVDLASGASTDLSARSVRIRGATIQVKVPSNLLPSTGRALTDYRFNFWPEDGGPPVSSSIASFLPEFNNAQVGTSGRG